MPAVHRAILPASAGSLRRPPGLLRCVLADQRAIHDHLRGSDTSAASLALVADDLDVAVEIRNLRQTVVERDQVAQAVKPIPARYNGAARWLA